MIGTDRATLTSLGLMSGSSCDGIDAAIVRIDFAGSAPHPTVLASRTVPYESGMRHLLLNAGRLSVADLALADFSLGQLLADAAIQLCDEAAIPPDQIDLIASHGHTVSHDPPVATLQIGQGAVIAAKTGRLTVTDFRPADLAVGGQGAPLVPRLDALLAPAGSGTVMLNIGGIANLTFCPTPERVIALDTGPGNILIDAATMAATHGQSEYDAEGALAQSGTVAQETVDRFIADEPFFRQAPPKSTGREQFGPERLESLGPPGADAVATATWITVQSIADAVERFLLPAGPVARLVVSGGGAHNRTLIDGLRARLAPVSVEPLEQDGFTVENKEAAAFALLGALTVRGEPANLPDATGATRPAILGRISQPPPARDQ